MAEQRKETFGSSITEGVYNQLTARSNLYSKASKNKLDQVAINSSTAYVKVRSSVDIVTDEGSTSGPDDRNRALPFTQYQDLQQGQQGPYNDVTKDPPTSSYLAKNFILTGGAIKVGEEGYRGGVGKQRNGSFLTSDKAYNNYGSLGYRPMPGVTAFKIASQNTYGTIRIAEIDFTVWSVEDLELAEKIYLKPGYSMLVEWGHTVFINNSGEIRRAGKELFTIPDKEWFKKGQSSQVILDLIEKKRQNSSYNYDGFWGYCSNFSYSFRPDGGYDCSIKIISAGQVLESIKAGKTDDTGKVKDDKKDADENIVKQKSPFHLVFKTLEEYNSKQNEEANFNDDVLNVLKDKIKFKTKEFEPFSAFQLDLVNVSTDHYLFNIDKNVKQNLVYIPFKALLDIFNKTSSIYTKVGGKLEPIIRFDNSYGETFLTFDGHFSTNPNGALMPNPADGYKITNRRVSELMALSADPENRDKNDIMDIYFSTAYLVSKLDSFIDGAQKAGTGMFDFFKSICVDLNDMFAINSFDIFYNESNNQYRIIDRKQTPPRGRAKVINLTGLKSTVVDLNISSKITPNIASQISIAAVGSEGAQYKENVKNIMQWNQGAVDRVILVKSTSPTDETDKKENQCGADKPSEEYKTKVKNLYDSFNKGTFMIKEWDSLKPQLKAEILRRFNCTAKSKTLKGVIPVELSLKMEGIAGLKIAQAFRINRGILPRKYDNWGYIITGLDHEIGPDNKWFTNIKTQFYYDQNG